MNGDTAEERPLGLLVVLAAGAEQGGKVPRIGILRSASVPSATDAFMKGLRDVGYVEGQNIVLAGPAGGWWPRVIVSVVGPARVVERARPNRGRA